MRTVARFTIPLDEPYFELELPLGAIPLYISAQERAPFLPSMWVLLDPDRESVGRRKFLAFNPTVSADVIEPPVTGYIGSFQETGFVWHVWEVDT